MSLWKKSPNTVSTKNPDLAFLKDTSLSGEATPEEIEFLKRLKFKGSGPPPSTIIGSYKVSEIHFIFGRPRLATFEANSRLLRKWLSPRQECL